MWDWRGLRRLGKWASHKFDINQSHGWRKRKKEILTHGKRPEAVQWMRWQIWKALESSNRASLCTHVVKLFYSVTEIINPLELLIQLMPGVYLLTTSRSLGSCKADHVDNSIAPSFKAGPRFLWDWMKWKEQMIHVTVKSIDSLDWRSNGAVGIFRRAWKIYSTT